MDNLFEKAVDWYQSNNPGKREAALELFPEEKLKKEVEKFREKVRKEKLEAREEQLKKTLERCKKLFPIGTPMWNHDGTDHCPNIVISEPYITETKYSIPDGAYDYGYSGPKKTIMAKVIRMSTTRNEPLEGDWKYSTINLEICLNHMETKTTWGHKDHIINLNEYYKTRNEEKETRVKWLKETINQKQASINELIDELNTLEIYKPEGLTKELISEIVKKYA